MMASDAEGGFIIIDGEVGAADSRILRRARMKIDARNARAPEQSVRDNPGRKVREQKIALPGFSLDGEGRLARAR
jgi:hypothetical protein